MKKLIVVADWASDSLSPAEFRSSVGGFLKSADMPDISFVASTTSTIHTAFLAAQVVETEERLGRASETVIFLNTDPRLPKNEGSINKEGSQLLIIKLKSGIFMVGPNAGYCFSMIKPKIDEVFFYDVSKDINQFRSRDLYTRILSHLMEYMEKELELEEIHLSSIVDLDDNYIGHIDNFGNMKTTIKKSDMKGKYKVGDEIEITINKITNKAKFATGLFSDKPNILLIYPGSSGLASDPYLEISIWNYFDKDKISGASFFDYPNPGNLIKIK